MAIAASFPSIKPSLSLDFANVGALDPRVTFTRSTTGTYYDGVTTAKAEENLLVQSQTFNTTWIPQSATVGSDVEVAPDGSATADKVQETTDSAPHLLAQTITFSATPYTLSVYLKAAERGYAFVTYITTTGISVNLSTGAVSTAVGSPTNVTSVDAGNGWWRVSFTFTPIASTTFVYIYTSTDGIWANRIYAGTTGSGIYVWGAQLEQRSSATAYTPTTTQPITNYIPVLQTAAAGQARFDHNPTTGEALGLLIEEQRTNLLTYSEEFDNAAWTKNNVSITANTVVAPDGTLTGEKLVENTANSTHYVHQSLTPANSTAYSFSCFAKAGERSVLWLNLGFTGGGRLGYNLLNGTVVAGTIAASNGSITPVGNGWYRCTLVVTTTSTAAGQIQIGCTNAADASTISYTGDGYSGIYIWGAQLEAGAFPTSYIPTTSAQVTRNADAASMTGADFSSWYNAGEGSFYLEGVGQATARTIAGIGQGTFQTTMAFNVVNLIRVSGASPNVTLGTGIGGTVKLAAAIKPGNFAASANGAAAIADSTYQTLQFAANRFEIGQATGYNVYNGTIKKIAYYPQRLTNAQLQALTA